MPRLTINLSEAEFLEIGELARRTNASMAQMGQLAVKHLLIRTKEGALPMLPKVDLDAIKSEPLNYTVLGETQSLGLTF